MKKIITTSFLLLAIGNFAFSQYFQGNISNVGNKVTVKIKPTGNITDVITSVDFFFRSTIAGTPAYTISNVTPNTATFPGLTFSVGGFSDITHKYNEFLFTSTIPSNTYVAGTEYVLLTFTLDGVAPAVANIELASDFNLGSYYFAITGTSGSLFDAGSGDQFYGPGFNKVGSAQFLPLNSIPLPVKFLGFDVVKKNNSALLNWSVENETALTDKYIIESSANSTDFTPVATIAASNNGRGSNTYNFIQDNLSAIRNSGVIYYRVKQVDKDGKFVYTPIKAIRLDGKAFAVNAYPNPVKSSTKLTIDLLDDSKVLISITDAAGRQVKTIQLQGFKGPNIKDVNLSNLSNGNYMLKVQAGNEVKSLPLAKVN
jgi:Secretion system C-terminal sorting domain